LNGHVFLQVDLASRSDVAVDGRIFMDLNFRDRAYYVAGYRRVFVDADAVALVEGVAFAGVVARGNQSLGLEYQGSCYAGLYLYRGGESSIQLPATVG